jgi:hypothetical protein
VTPRADALIREALSGRLDERLLTVDEVREIGRAEIERRFFEAVASGQEAFEAFISEAGGMFNWGNLFLHRNAAWLSPEGDVHPLPNEGTKNGRPANEYWHMHWAEDPDNQHKIPEHIKVKNADGTTNGAETKERMLQNKWVRVAGVNHTSANFEATDHPGLVDKLRSFLFKHHQEHLDSIADRGGFTVSLFHPETGASLGEKRFTLTGKRAPEDVSDVARARKLFQHPTQGSYGEPKPKRRGF